MYWGLAGRSKAFFQRSLGRTVNDLIIAARFKEVPAYLAFNPETLSRPFEKTKST
jgi:hypothetical protein